MSIERIKNYLTENAQKEADLIVKTAGKHVEEQIEAAKLSLKKHYQEMFFHEKELLVKNMEKTLVLLKKEYSMSLLEVKNNVIEGVLARAISGIQSLSDEEYLALIRKWLTKIPNHLEGQLFINENDLKKITVEFVNSINETRKERVFLNKNPIDIKGGFIFKTENCEIDYTLDTIVKNLRKTVTPQLGKILKLSDVKL